MKIAFLLYPTAHVRPSEDTSFWIMLELARRGHDVTYFESERLFWEGGRAFARVRRTRLDLKKGFLPSPLVPRPLDLTCIDAVFIRKEPPFDTAYLHALQILENIKDKTFIVNDPAGIAIANEKLFTLRFGRFVAETLVTSDPFEVRRFVKRLGAKVVLKRIDDKGGAGIFASDPRDRNLPSLAEMATDFGKRPVMVQRYVPVEKHGDKRILILDGEAIGAYVRRPPAHDFRANISRGATFHRAALTPADRRLTATLAPELERLGLYFTGIDVIGTWLTEINVTSPAGISDLNALERTHLERRVADFLERKCSEFRRGRRRRL